MPNLKHATMTAAIALCATVTVIGNAKADVVYGGGSTLASVVYRQLMDTWNFPLVLPNGCGATATDMAHLNNGLPEAAVLYAGVGSGAGKRALVNHDAGNNNGTGLGTATPGLPPPYTVASSCTTSPAWAGYPFMHFAGSDDVITASDMATYNANNGPSKWGKLIQFPTFVTPVNIAYNPAGLNLPPGGLNLTRKQVCGIFSGHVTDWSDPIFATSGDGGGPLSSSSLPITVVHRQDGSGTSFLTTNALKAQCAGIVGPNNAKNNDNTPALWEMSWTDRTVASSQCPAIPSRGSNQLNWPDLITDQCGAPIANPGGGTFVQATHTDQVACTISGTNGAIGYVSPDFAQPIKATLTSCGVLSTTAPLSANLQNQYGVDNDPANAPTFVAPTAANATAAMASVSPNFPTDAALTNPLNWSTQGIVPNPLGQNAYPIAGFTWLDMYQCYNQSTAAGNVLGTIEGYLQFFYGGYNQGVAAGILNSNGFAVIPPQWSDALTSLVATSSARLGAGGTGVCAGIPGA